MAVIDELLVALKVGVDAASFRAGAAALDGLTKAADGAEASTEATTEAVVEMVKATETAARGVDKVADSATSDRFRQATDALRGMAAAGTALGAIIGGAVVGLFGLSRATAKYADDAHDAAAAIGLDAEALLQLQWAATRATGSADGLDGALLRLARSSQDAIDGGAESAKAFARLGIAVDDLRGLKPDAVLRLIADGMQRIPTDTERASLAMDLLGRSGARLVPLLTDGAAGIDRLRDRAAALGVTVSKVDEDAAGEFNDTLDDLYLVSGALTRRIGGGLIPTFTRWGKAILDAYERNRDLINQRLDVWIGAVDRGLRALEGPLGVVVAGLTAMAGIKAAKGLLDVAAAVPVFGGALKGAAASVRAFAVPLAGLVLAAALAEDVFQTSKGGKSLINRIAEWAGADDKTLAQIQLFTKYVVDLAGALERLAQINLARVAWLFSGNEAAARIANREPLIADPFEGMGPNGVRWSGGLDAERARFAEALTTPASAGGRIPEYLRASPNVTMTVNVNGGDPDEVRRATREGVLDAYQQFPAAR